MISPGDRTSYQSLLEQGHAPAVAFCATQHNDAQAVRALATLSADPTVFAWWLHVCHQQPTFLVATVAELPSPLPTLGDSLQGGVLRLLANAFHPPRQRTQAAVAAAGLFGKLAGDDDVALRIARAALGAPPEGDDVAALFETSETLVDDLVEAARRRLASSGPADRELLIRLAAEQQPQLRCDWLLMLAEPYREDEVPHVVAAIKDAAARCQEGSLGSARQLFARLDVGWQFELLVESTRLINGDLVHHLGPERWRVLVEKLTRQDDTQEVLPALPALPALLGLVGQLASSQAPELLLWAHARYNAELFADTRARMISTLQSGYSRRDQPPGVAGRLVLLALLSGDEKACQDAAAALDSAALDPRLLGVRRDFDAHELRQFLDSFAADENADPTPPRQPCDPDILSAAGAVMAWQMLPERTERQFTPQDARLVPQTVAAHVVALLSKLSASAGAAVGRGLLTVLDVDGPRLLPPALLDALHHPEGLKAFFKSFWVEKLVNTWREQEDAAGRLVDFLEANGRQLSGHDLEFVMQALDQSREVAPGSWSPDLDQRLALALPPDALVRELVTQAGSLHRPQALQAPAERLVRLLKAVLKADEGQAAYGSLNSPDATLSRLAEHADQTLSDLTARWLAHLEPSPDVVHVAVAMRDSRLGTNEYAQACARLAAAAAARTTDEQLSDEGRITALHLARQADSAQARSAAFELLAASPPAAVRRAAAGLLANTPAQAGDSDRLGALMDAERDRETHRELTSALRAVRSGSVGQALQRLLEIGRVAVDTEPDLDEYLPYEATRPVFQQEVDDLLASLSDTDKGYLASASTLAELLVEQGVAAHLLYKSESKHFPQAERLLKRATDKPTVGSLIVRQDLLQGTEMAWLSSVHTLREFRPAHPDSKGADGRRFAEVLLPMIIEGWAVTMLRCSGSVRAWIATQKP